MFSRLCQRPPARRPRPARARYRLPLRLEVLEDRTLPAAPGLSLADAIPVHLPARLTGTLDAPAQDHFYSFLVTRPERLTARLTADDGSPLDPRLALLEPSGQELVRSDDVAPGDVTAQVAQHLTPGRYVFRVSAQVGSGPAGAGDYVLTAGATADLLPGEVEDLTLGPVADVNGDGRPDLVTVDHNSYEVSVLLGNGDGTFGRPRFICYGYSAAVADVNGDGKPDLLVADYYSERAVVLLGNGDGSFQDPILTPGTNAYFVAAADVNGDGKPDLLVGGYYSYGVSVLLGNGDGSFQDPIPAASDGYAKSLMVAVVDGDANPDLLVGSYYSDGVSVLLGNGDGSFQDPILTARGSYV